MSLASTKDAELGRVPPPPARLPGVEGFWVFIAGDLALFTILFGRFLVQRTSDAEAFETARHSLSSTHGGINTLLLLTSSMFVARALIHARAGAAGPARRSLGVGITLGLGFVASKVWEYSVELKGHQVSAGSDFFVNYFTLTGLHLFHVVLGCLLLAAFHRRWRKGIDPTRLSGFESVACFWHLVDFLWIVIFPLLYLAR